MFGPKGLVEAFKRTGTWAIHSNLTQNVRYVHVSSAGKYN